MVAGGRILSCGVRARDSGRSRGISVAHVLALRGVLARTPDDPERKADLEKLIGELETKLKDGKVKD
jgi:hypothetical protein